MCREPVLASRFPGLQVPALLLAGFAFLCAGPHVQADAGDASFRFAAAGFLAVEPFPNQSPLEIGRGEDAFLPLFGRHLHRRHSRPKGCRRRANHGQLSLDGPRGKRAGFLLPISGKIILAGKSSFLLSPSGPLAPDGGGGRRAAAVGRVRVGLDDAAQPSLLAGGLVLVHRDPGAGDWPGASGVSIDRQSLYLCAIYRIIPLPWPGVCRR